MTDIATGTPLPAVAPKGLLTRVIGVFTSPRETYADIAARPTVLGAFILSLLLIVVPTGVLSTTERGKEMAIDQDSRMQGWSARWPADSLTRHTSGWRPASPAAYPLPADRRSGQVPFRSCSPSRQVCCSVFTSILGGDARFKNVLALVVFASIIGSVGALFAGDHVREAVVFESDQPHHLSAVSGSQFILRRFPRVVRFVPPVVGRESVDWIGRSL